MQSRLRVIQIARLATAVGLTLAVGTIGFHRILHESWFQAFYRSVVTATLAGLDTIPPTNGARVLSIALVIAGLTIIAYTGAVIVETIAGGVLTG
ncbi:MAG TPA: ion channel, partial [Gaiellaceae bacterium]|nr:ion channel [Gaiellaceae bacterium]